MLKAEGRRLNAEGRRLNAEGSKLNAEGSSAMVRIFTTTSAVGMLKVKNLPVLQSHL